MNTFKTIYVLPHSHFDYGYTHPQPMLAELQLDYLDEVIELCEASFGHNNGEQFRWTIEAHAVLEKWLESSTSTQIARLRRLIQAGRIAVTALPFHTTPMCDLPELWDLPQAMMKLETMLDYKIRTAINHDVNGQPWTLQQVLKKAGIELYLTGINIHFGGIPFERPATFLWEGTDGSHLRCFLGEHYSLFSQFSHSERIPTLFAKGASEDTIYHSMLEEITRYESALKERSWNQDFYVLTATNPPLYDNNNPDTYLVKAVQIFNRKSRNQTIKIITIDDLRTLLDERFEEDELAVKRGDWTDYWNFGVGSTPHETRIHKRTQQTLRAVDFVDSLISVSLRHEKLVDDIRARQRLHSEHTWGAAESIQDPWSDMTMAQRYHKDHLAWDAAALASYALGERLEAWAGRPGTFSLADTRVRLRIVNPSQHTLTFPVPAELVKGLDAGEGTSLASLRTKSLLSFERGLCTLDEAVKEKLQPVVTVQGFSLQNYVSTDLKTTSPGASFRVDEGQLETPYYKVKWTPDGHIESLVELQSQREWVDSSSTIPFAALVRETLDSSEMKDRKSFFDRDVNEGNLGYSNWNHEWKSCREVINSVISTSDGQTSDLYVRGFEYGPGHGYESAQVLFTFFRERSGIDVELRIQTIGQMEPEAYYLAFPVSLPEGWRGCFDSAGALVHLDEEQMGNVSKDWITCDRFYAVYEGKEGFLMASTDTPLVQPSGFGFGLERSSIPREANPLVLGWLSNNYWETNFAASVTGTLTSHYTILPTSAFQVTKVMEWSEWAARPWVATLTTDENPDTTTYCSEGDAIQLEYLCRKGDGLALVYRNQDNETPHMWCFEDLTLEEGDRCAYALSPTGVLGDRIPMEGRKLSMIVQPGELGAVCIRKGDG